MTVELRGSHEHLLPEFAAALLDLGHMPQTVTLCTDDVFPDDLHVRGGLDRVVRLLMSHGLPPAWVYRAATLNAATRIGRGDLGLDCTGATRRHRAGVGSSGDCKCQSCVCRWSAGGVRWCAGCRGHAQTPAPTSTEDTDRRRCPTYRIRTAQHRHFTNTGPQPISRLPAEVGQRVAHCHAVQATVPDMG